MKRIAFLLLVAATVFSCEKPIYQFQSENFVKFFGGGYESAGNDIIELADGGYVLTGHDNVAGVNKQIFTAKVDKNGNLIWSNTYGSPASAEEGTIVREEADGFLIAGTSTSASGISHSFIMKLSAYGDSLWYKEFGNPGYSIILNDIAITDQFIFVAGESYSSSVTKSDYFWAKLDLSGNVIWEKLNYLNSGSTFSKVFPSGEDLLIVGTDGDQKKVAVISILQSNGNSVGYELAGSDNESVADVLKADNILYILVNTSGGTRLHKLDLNLQDIWVTETINSVTGKSVAMRDDGSLFICGESTTEGTTYMNFIDVDPSGTALYGSEAFRTLEGNVRKVLQTSDKGLILIGASATFGSNIQLIKTDKDFFMLKP